MEHSISICFTLFFSLLLMISFTITFHNRFFSDKIHSLSSIDKTIKRNPSSKRENIFFTIKKVLSVFNFSPTILIHITQSEGLREKIHAL